MENRFYNAFDCERLEPPKPPRVGETRTPFQTDRDRIIYTSAFRRLQAKTQVFLSGEYDFYRTRLTHSIEVAQIGRSICHHLKSQRGSLLADDFFIDSDLVEAVCLTHDLGHPPFGHAGERTLHELMREHFGGFEGNAQSLRIITETIFSSGETRRGMNPTRAFLDGILKYKTAFRALENADHHFIYDAQTPLIEFAFGTANHGLSPGAELNGFRSIECQIMDWADDSAYSLNDIVDGIRARFITLEKVRAWLRKNSDFIRTSHAREIITVLRKRNPEAAFGAMIGKCVSATSLTARENFLSAKTCRYAFDLAISPEMRERIRFYKKLSNALVFASVPLQQIEQKSDYLLRRIFDSLNQLYLANREVPSRRLLPEDADCRLRNEPDIVRRARLLCDYLAGMTDGFAVRMFKRFFDPDFFSIADLSS